MFSRLPNELKKMKNQDSTLNDVLHYYDQSSNKKYKSIAKKIWIEKRKKRRKEAGLEPEDKENLEAAFNRNLKRLNEKKQQIKEEEEFQIKKNKYTKAYEQKQINDLKQGKGIRYRNSKAWEYKKNKNNKTRKSPLSQVHHTPTDAFTPEERKRLTQINLMDKESERNNVDWGKISGGKKRKKRKTRKKRKKKTRKTRKRRSRSRRRRKTRRKRAGNKIHQNEVNKGTDGCYTLHHMSEVTKCINQGGLDKYNKKHKSKYQKSHISSTTTYN